MRKLYLSILAMMAVVMTAHAWSYDMKEEHPILQGSEYNMRLFKSIDYVNCTVNGVAYSDGADFTYGEATKDISINVYNPVPVLNEGLEFMWVQITGTKGVYERSGYGLWNGFVVKRDHSGKFRFILFRFCRSVNRFYFKRLIWF